MAMWCRTYWREAVAVLMLAGAGRAPAAEARFVRAVNLNGPPLVIDGRQWQGEDAADFTAKGQRFENQSVLLRPAVERSRAQMLRSSVWGGNVDLVLRGVPPGPHQVFVHVWEDNASERVRFEVNGRIVLEAFDTGGAGAWKRLGPWPATAVGDVVTIAARGGAANLSGVELWSGDGPVPAPAADAGFNAAPTPEQLAFFESRIRPLFATHCQECHSAGAKTLRGGLLLDSRAGVRRGGDSGPAVLPGDPDSSLLLAAVRRTSADLAMPPKRALAAHEIADLAEWVRMGAPDPRTDDTVALTRERNASALRERADWWSLKPLTEPVVPAVRDAAWPAGDLDRFVLARMESDGLAPASGAGRRVLLRRAAYDLTGLPPSPEELEAFERDPASDAFAKAVDRLLDSPRYGERWGRHWLDVVRYADTAGDNSDFPIPQMHRYRDWVIDAVNRDLPYPEFVRQQLAGDLMEGGSDDERRARIIATGYLANARRFGSRVDDYPWHLTIEDTIDNFGRAFLGLTINCARCHDHKFDPVTTQDYYALYGIFRSTRYPWPGIELEQKQRDLVPLFDGEEGAKRRTERERKIRRLDARIKAAEKAVASAPAKAKAARERERDHVKAQRQELAAAALMDEAYAVADAGEGADAAVQRKGDPAQPGETVRRRFLTVLGGRELPPGASGSGRRQLADWLFAPDNPLPARVIVNRVWQHHFGRGLVATPNDFGRQGGRPSHPELLDWLALRFIEDGWSLKALHRRILLSRTWQQSGERSVAAVERDAAGELLAGFPRRRLDAEQLRDTLLLLGGSLQLDRPGPHPFPMPADWKFTQHNPFKEIYDTPHRAVYLMTPRIQRHPFLAVFDGADAAASTANRMVTTTPLQSLFLLNDPLVHREAERAAVRLCATVLDPDARLTRLHRELFGRVPRDEEVRECRQFLKQAAARLEVNENAAGPWASLTRALLRTNEFSWID